MMCKDGKCEGGMKSMCIGHKISALLLFIGGVNWGLIGLGGFMSADWNVVHMILGSWPAVEWVVYILVGLSALMMLAMKKCCGGGMCGCGAGCKGEGSCKGGEAGSCKGGSCSGAQK